MTDFSFEGRSRENDKMYLTLVIPTPTTYTFPPGIVKNLTNFATKPIPVTQDLFEQAAHPRSFGRVSNENIRFQLDNGGR